MTHIPETGNRKMESTYSVGFWSVCHSANKDSYYRYKKLNIKPKISSQFSLSTSNSVKRTTCC